MNLKKIESLYLHFPFCRHLCNYCDFFKKVPTDRAIELDEFHQYIQKSFCIHQEIMEKYFYTWGPLKTLYIGGGTPSLWGIEGKNFLQNFLVKNNLTLDSHCEFTLEVNPGSWTQDTLEAWESIGVNRYSLGIQSLNAELIKHLDRVHSLEDVYETLTYFHKNQLNFSVDFMIGLPHSEKLKRDVIAELELALTYNPSHFSVYILTVKDNYKFYSHLPSEEWIEKEFLEVANFLKKNGYIHYEVSNFSLPGKQSNHNLQYWRSNSVAALGPSATGFLSEERIRYKWKTKEAAIETEALNAEEFKLEKLYMALRSEGIDLKKFQSIDPSWTSVVEKWKNAGWAQLSSEGHLKITSEGFLLLDSLINDTFALKF